MLRTAVLCCILHFIYAIGLPLSMQAQQRPALPSEYASVDAWDAVPVHRMPAVEGERDHTTEKGRPPGEIGPYRYGTVLDTRLTPRQQGVWERLPTGRWLWRVRVQSAEARSVSLGFSTFDLPEGSRLCVHDGEGTTVWGPYTGQDATGGAHWTPRVEGEEIVVELEVAGDRRSDVRLVLSDVVHADRAIFPNDRRRALSKRPF